jgi:membrane protease subunit (stomatin/prohibitin family)
MAITNVIKYEGDNQTLIWKHPEEDFNTGTQLIVHESQEAVFFMNGQALDSFGAGRHTLTTQNMPFVSKFFNLVTGGESPFHCEIYFINKTEQMAIKWGTDSRMEYIEPNFNFPVKLGACGEMNIRVENGRKLLIKVVGTEAYQDQADIARKLRSFLIVKLKPCMVNYLRENSVNIFQIDEHLQIISDAMRNALYDDFSEYGIALENFFINTVIKPEDDSNYIHFRDLYFRQYASIAEAKLQQQLGIIEQETEAKKMIIEAQSLAQKRSIEGYTYLQERQFDVAEGFANNEGVGDFSNLGIGMGLVGAVSNSVGSKVNDALLGTINETTPVPQNNFADCPVCRKNIPVNGKFCPECGTKVDLSLSENKVICPKCKAMVAKGKFCLECGSPLKTICSGCQAELPDGAKFCLECGTKVN